MRNLRVALISTTLVCAAGTVSAAIIPIRQMELAGQATVTASPWDIGSKDNLFNGNWGDIYRTDAVSNPAIITVSFVTAQATGAARGMFSHTPWYQWSLDAANTLADLNSQSGTFVHIFGPLQVPGDMAIQWQEWNDTPVTRKVYRFTVYRMSGDNHVHIEELELQSPEPVQQVDIDGQLRRVNVIEVDPASAELGVGTGRQYTATASLSYGPDRYDVTDLCIWSTDGPVIASVSAAGYVSALAQGTTAVNADLGVVHGEGQLTVRAYLPADLDVGFIHRTPEYNRFMVDFSADQRVHPTYVDEQKWPDPGELVTYTAHIFNKGDATAANAVYRWYFDGHLADEGTIASLAGQSSTTVAYTAPWPADTVQTVDIPPGAMVLHPRQLERAVGNHRIRCEIDPDNAIAEGCENNNAVEDYINAITFWLFMDQTTYGYFHKHANFLESNSAEDWGRMQVKGFERRLRIAGCPQKVRLDMLAVYPDGGLNAGGTHEPNGSETRQADGRWGFQISEWPESKVTQYAKIVENPLMHEWGHQIGIIDIYQYDIATGNCLIRYNGSLVAGTSLMPTVSPWNIWYGNIHVQHAGGSAVIDWTDRALMADVARQYIGPGCAAGMNRNLGLRRGFFGDYLGAIQQGVIKLKVQHYGGTPVANCAIRVFQRDASTTQVPNNPKFVGTTDAAGQWAFPHETEPGWNGGMAVNNPWSAQYNGVTYNCPNAIGGDAPLIVELHFGATVEYHFVEVDELNVAMGQGVLDDYTIALTTYSSRASNHLPVISFNGAPASVYVNEGALFQATISATDADGDPVTLRATPLWNSTFDPATGHFAFQPDSLQVNRYGASTETMYVDFVADDGKFRSSQRMTFYVADVPGYVRLTEPPFARLGDLKCDGVTNFDDINPFVLALVSQAAFEAAYPACDYRMADCNGDGTVDFDDINPFVTLLTQ